MSNWVDVAMVAPFVVLGSMANRHRGGWLGTGHTQLARFDFAVWTALMYFVASFAAGALDWRASLVVLVLMPVGCLAGQGSDQAANTWGKAVGLYCSGAVNILGIALATAWARLGHPTSVGTLIDLTHLYGFSIVPRLLFILAVSMPLAWVITPAGKPAAYRLGKYLPGDLLPQLFGQGFLRGQTEWGEALFGACEGLFILACNLL